MDAPNIRLSCEDMTTALGVLGILADLAWDKLGKPSPAWENYRSAIYHLSDALQTQSKYMVALPEGATP